VRLLNTLIFFKSDAKSRLAGAGFEPRQIAAGLRLEAQPADLVRILTENKKEVGSCLSGVISFYFGAPVEQREIPLCGGRIRTPPNCGGTSL